MESTSTILSDNSTTAIKPCPWGKAASSEPISLADVMSEELAKSLQEKEDNWLKERDRTIDGMKESDKFDLINDPDDDPDCTDDVLLAKYLQMEFDKEHDDILALEERKYNGSSKVSVSFDKYRRLPSGTSSDEEDYDDDTKQEHWDSFEKAQKNSPNIGKNGIARQGKNITTKHDATVCGRRNACRVMEFPPGISTGDGGSFDMQLPNNVYNSLKVHSKAEERRSHRLHDKKEKSTAEQALDPKTRLIMYKLVNNQTLEGINGCISTGKEACVFHAWGGGTEEHVVPSECAVKVFKTVLNEFKNRDQYIRDDYRFRDRFSKQNPRKVIHMWAEKEMRNLSRMRKAGLPCPEVVALKKHVLVMTFIGAEQKPAPKLKEVKLTPAQMAQAYSQAVDIMKRLFHECHLVHADLSEYNLLWHNSQLWVIDVSQSVEPTHPNALEFLFRDCNNIVNFFTKQGIAGVPSAKDLFTQISGLQLPGEGADLLSEIQNYERNEEILAHGCSDKSDYFDVLFEKCSSGPAVQTVLTQPTNTIAIAN